MCIGHLYVLFGEVSIQGPLAIFNWVICFFVCCFLSSLYILEINPLPDVSLANIFSHTVGSLLILLIVSFAVQKLF